MRITNQMTINTLLLNLNKSVTSINKSMLQMATGQKIQMASEDPIIAALALKFRTNVAKTKQYKANTNQAESWMNVTESSISNTNKILQGIYDLCTEAASDTYNTDRKTLIDQISQFKKQLINEANSDYAGRYVFGGFKTDQKLMFTEEVKEKYNITQKFTKDHIETVKVPVPEEKQVLTGSYEEDNYLRGNGGKEVTEVKRIKLPYNYTTNLKFTDSAGNAIEGTYINSENTVLSGDFDAYRIGDDDIKYVADTGEILIGKNIAQKLEDTKNFNLSYDKENFKAGDLNPIQYFDCRKYMTGETRLVNNTLITPKPDVAELTINYGNNGAATLTNGINSLKSTDEDAYKVQPDEIRYLTDTGEILFGKNIADEIKETNNISVSYKNKEENFKYDGTKEFPNSITIPSKNSQQINLSFTDADGVKKIFSSELLGDNNIAIKKSTDENATNVSDNGITYISDTGEILFGKNILASVTNSKDLNISAVKSNEVDNFKVDGTKQFPSSVKIKTKNASEVSLSFTDLEGTNKIFSSALGAENPIVIKKSTDEGAYTVEADGITYISDTGEILFGKNLVPSVINATDLDINATADSNTDNFKVDGTKKFPNSFTIDAVDLDRINLSFTDNGISKTYSSDENAANKIIIRNSTDEGASTVGDNEIVYLKDTGEFLFGRSGILANIMNASDLDINAIKDRIDNNFNINASQEFKNSLTIETIDATEINLSFTDLDGTNKTFSSVDGSANKISIKKSSDVDANIVDDNGINYISDTGEIIFGKNIMPSIMGATDLDINAIKDGLNQNFQFNGTEEFPSSLTIDYVDLDRLNLSFTGIDGIKKEFSSEEGATNKIIVKNSYDSDATLVGDNEIVYLQDTGKFMFGKNLVPSIISATDLDINTIKDEITTNTKVDGTEKFSNFFTIDTDKSDQINISFTDATGINRVFSSIDGSSNKITIKTSTDADAKVVEDNGITYIGDTGEILFGKNLIPDVVNATDFDINTIQIGAVINEKFDGTEEFKNSLTIEAENSDEINLSFTDLNGTVKIYSSVKGSPNEITTRTSTDDNAKVVGDNEIVFISDTGEILFGKNLMPSIMNAKDLDINAIKKNDISDFKLDGTELFDNILTIPTKNAAKLELTVGETTYTLNSGINKVVSTDENAYKVGKNEIKYISDTGELVFGENILATVSSTKDLKVTTQDAPENFKDYKGTFNAVEKYPKSLTIDTKDAAKISLSFTANGAKKTFSSEDEANKINIKTSSDKDASLVGDNEITYLSDTGEVIFGKNILASVSQAADLNIKATVVTGKVETPKEFKFDGTKEFSNVLKAPIANAKDLEIEANGKKYKLPSDITSVTSKDANAYKVGDNEIKYVTDTGEIIFGKNINLNLESGINITSSYGTCEVGELISNKTNDKMEYEFGTDNKMDINVNGSDVFTWELIADLDDLVVALGSVTERTEDEIKEQLKKDMGKDYNKLTEDELSKIVADIQDSEEKTCREVLASRFSSAITKIQNHNEHATLTRSELGSRMKRLDLISERLENDKVTYTDLMTSNEGVDYEETVMNYMSQQAIYNSALSVGSQIIQKSLVDFI